MAVVLQAVSVRQLSYSLTTDSASASHHPRPAATSSGRSSLVSISCVGGEMHGSPTYARAAVSSLSYSITALFTPHRVIVQYRANGRFAGIDLRGVATAGGPGDASPVRRTMSPYIKMTTDSLSLELTFDE